jgi:AmmeMemoRadiSam system protein B
MKVADAFYPADPVVLKQMLDYFFSNVEPFKIENIKAWVSPHAGYVYSGQVAAYTYEAIRQNLDNIPKTIFVMSPDHYIGMNKVLLGNYDELETPFWNLKVNKKVVTELLENFPSLFTDEYLMYDQEHAQETQYPFLKYILGDKSNEFKIVPLIFGQVDIMQVATVLENYVWKAFFLISSDLSHYKPYEEAIQVDERTLDILINKKLEELNFADACGIFPWWTLVLLAKKFNWEGKLLKYLNSWDTAWDKSKVVGYASVIYTWH